MQVIKESGERARFDSSKVRNWVIWSVADQDISRRLEMEYYILTETIKRLPEIVTTAEIHETMIAVCIDKEDIEYSRVAARLELASIYKAQERLMGIYQPQDAEFSEILDVMEARGKWNGEWLEDPDLITHEDLINEWFIELEAVPLEYCTVKQWSDSYSIREKGLAIESPAAGCLAIAIAYHGVTELAFGVAKDLVESRLNLPTPALNGVRNGDFNSISCCIIEGGDSVESIDTAEHIASRMTAKKAGIGISYATRSKGDSVKNGAVEHLGKQPIYKALESSIKKYTQLTRGGSATMTYKCIDPEIMNMLLWKTQRIDLSQRIDKIDYSFAYNDDFALACLHDADWYLFSLQDAPEVHEAFHQRNYMDVVKSAIRRGAKYKKVRALDILQEFLKGRVETSRMYCINLTRTNSHTPFIDRIIQSNLCLEIALPTKPYVNMEDLYLGKDSEGETAFCSIAALNVANISDEEYPEVSERALRTVDKMIEKAPMMTESMKTSLLARKSVGIGVTGAASKIYKAGLDYDGSKESLDMIEEMAELHYYCLLMASQKMAAETGVSVDGINTYWLPVDTKIGNKEPTLDWEVLRNKPRAHSVLVAHMPTEKSSAFSNATNSWYPSRERVMYKGARKGRIQFISQYFTPDKLTAWKTDMAPYYGAIGNYTDQTTSSDYYLDFTTLPGRKVTMEFLIEWFIKQWSYGNKTAYYQNNLDSNGKEIVLEDSCEGGSCKL